MKSTRPDKNIRKRRRGVLTVEMAIVLPVFFLFLFASIEFSRMNTIRHTVENAAYEAARSAIVPGATTSKTKKVAKEIMQTIGCVGTKVTTKPRVIVNATPEVEVFVEVPCARNAYFAPSFFHGNITGHCRLRRERM